MSHIRKFEKSDIENIYRIYEPFVTHSSVTFETEMPSLAEFSERLISIAAEFPFLVLEIENEVCGYAYACRHRERKAYRWAVETSIYLSEKARNKGLGSKIYTALLDDLVKRKFVTAYGIITLPNDSSVMLHKKVGFEQMAIHKHAGYKLGEWHDVLWVEKTLNTPSDSPEEPIFKPI